MEEDDEMINPGEVLELYSIGIGCGIILSVIPVAIGLVVGLAIKIMKGV